MKWVPINNPIGGRVSIVELGSCTASDANKRNALQSCYSQEAAWYQVKPDYPRYLWAQGISGKVELILYVSPDGTVESCDVENQAIVALKVLAIDAVMTWRYKPSEGGISNGKCCRRVLVEFLLVGGNNQ